MEEFLKRIVESRRNIVGLLEKQLLKIRDAYNDESEDTIEGISKEILIAIEIAKIDLAEAEMALLKYQQSINGQMERTDLGQAIKDLHKRGMEHQVRNNLIDPEMV